MFDALITLATVCARQLLSEDVSLKSTKLASWDFLKTDFEVVLSPIFFLKLRYSSDTAKFTFLRVRL